MDATKIYNDLISEIEKSSLNYVMTKTPFSAQISLKRSLIKYFDSPKHTHGEKDVIEDTTGNVEMTKLREKLAVAEKVKERVEFLLEEEKDKVKSQEETFGRFRYELLQLKSEKKDLKSTLKKQEGELSDLKKKVDETKEEKVALENEFNIKLKDLKAKDMDYKKLEKGKVMLENELEKAR